LGAALLPRFVDQPGRYRRLAVLGTAAGTALAIGAAALFALIAPALGYGSAIVGDMRGVLLILSASFLARCSAYVLSAYMTAQGAQVPRLVASIAALVTMVSLDVVLIPTAGIDGAAWAMVAADWVLAIGYLLGSRRTAVRIGRSVGPEY